MGEQSEHNPATSDEFQAEIAQTRNESPSAAIPIPRSPEAGNDETSEDLAATLVNDRPSVFSPGRGWHNLVSRESSRQTSPVDRNR